MYGSLKHMHAHTDTLLPTSLLVHNAITIPLFSLLLYSNSCVGMDQLEAAFEIADTDGDGVLDMHEIQEALQVLYLYTYIAKCYISYVLYIRLV
jgi:EF-hand domain